MVAGKNAANIGHDRICGQNRCSEVALQHTFHIEVKLLIIGQVEAHFLTHTFNNVRRCAIADDCKNRINRDNAPNEECHGQKAKISCCYDHQKAGDSCYKG
jgi:predicted transposase YbfD/YdcC